MTWPVLHNMSTPPRTHVSARLKPAGPAVCRFRLATVRASASRLLADDTCEERLEAAWDGYGLRGACHVYAWRDDITSRPVSVRDPLLVLNVLGRTRAQVLLATAPLALEPDFLERELASDDPRLVALARGQS